MKNHLPFLLAILLITTLPACKTNDDNPTVQNPVYDFNVGVRLFDTQDEYQKDHVITFEVDAPNNILMEEQGGEPIYIGNATFNFDLLIHDFFPFTNSTPVFELILQEGVIEDATNFANLGTASLSFGCPAPNAKLKFGIKFKQSGNFLVQLNFNGAENIIFTGDTDCSIQNQTGIPPEASLGSVIYFFDINDVNKEEYDTYVMENPEALDEDIVPYVTALDNKLGYFVKVN